MIVGNVTFGESQKGNLVDILLLEAEIKRLKSCIRWYRAFVSQSAPIKSKTLLYLAQKAEDAYRSE